MSCAELHTEAGDANITSRHMQKFSNQKLHRKVGVKRFCKIPENSRKEIVSDESK